MALPPMPCSMAIGVLMASACLRAFFSDAVPVTGGIAGLFMQFAHIRGGKRQGATAGTVDGQREKKNQ